MKNKGSSAPGVPEIGSPASPSAFKKADVGTSSIRAPEIHSVPKQDLISKLQRMAPGWNAETEKIFALPDTLFKIEEDAATYYSKSESFGVGDVLNGLQLGRFASPLPDYAVGLFSTGGTAQIVLIDSSRNIIVRGKLFSVHDSKPEKDWSSFTQSVKSALAVAAQAKKEGAVAVFDGILKMMKAERA